MTKYFLLLFLPFLFLLSGCNNDDDAQPSMDEYLKGEWQETKVTVKVTDVNGVIVAETESTSFTTYSFNSGMLYISDWPQFSWNYTLEEENGQTAIQARYSVNYSFKYVITIVSEKEMVFTREAMQPGPDGALTQKSIRKHYLHRK